MSSQRMSKIRNVVVIGSGPAGHTAGIYAARANLAPLMFEGLVRGGIPGGQLMSTNDIENYPGFPRKIAGPELMNQFREQSLAQGVEIVTEDVERLDLSTRPFRVWATDATEPVEARSLIIATGAQAKWLGLESESALRGRGVSACAVCDGAFFRNEDVIVVGGGDTAMEEATYLAGLCKSVTLVHRRDEFRASQAMKERAKRHPKIRIRTNTVVEEVLDMNAQAVTGARLRDVKTQSSYTVAAKGFFVAIGHTPNSDLVRGQLELYDNGYIKTQSGSSRTSVEGVFACGDVQDFTYRQAITAAGSGCVAALDAERWLAHHE
jgi:thioredoxin reductase (NADPH)